MEFVVVETLFLFIELGNKTVVDAFEYSNLLVEVFLSALPLCLLCSKVVNHLNQLISKLFFSVDLIL